MREREGGKDGVSWPWGALLWFPCPGETLALAVCLVHPGGVKRLRKPEARKVKVDPAGPGTSPLACYLASKSPSMHRGDRVPPSAAPWKNFVRRTGRTAVGDKSEDRKWRLRLTFARWRKVLKVKCYKYCNNNHNNSVNRQWILFIKNFNKDLNKTVSRPIIIFNLFAKNFINDRNEQKDMVR